MEYTFPDILTESRFDHAQKHLKGYFNTDSTYPIYSGRRFNALGGAGAEAPNRITPMDVLALATLSVPARGSAVIRLLEDECFAEVVSTHLARIDPDASIEDRHNRKLLTKEATGSPPWELWRTVFTVPGFGAVSTSKLLARKRPHLFPIYDSVVAKALGISGDGNHWDVMVDIFEDEARRGHIEKLREHSDAPVQELSLLRIFDIVVWMEHRHLAG